LFAAQAKRNGSGEFPSRCELAGFDTVSEDARRHPMDETTMSRKNANPLKPPTNCWKVHPTRIHRWDCCWKLYAPEPEQREAVREETNGRL